MVGNGIDAFGFHENPLTLKRQNYTAQHLLDECRQVAFFVYSVSMRFFGLCQIAHLAQIFFAGKNFRYH